MAELQKLNECSRLEAAEIFSKCCGADNWINDMINARPFKTHQGIIETGEKIWRSLNETDWLEAFDHHPKIGDINSLREKFSSTKQFAQREQSGVNHASTEILEELAKLNNEYEKRFGYIFIVCATGKTADEMLSIIRNRITNDPETEIKIAMEEQNKITKLRLEKLL